MSDLEQARELLAAAERDLSALIRLEHMLNTAGSGSRHPGLPVAGSLLTAMAAHSASHTY